MDISSVTESLILYPTYEKFVHH